MKNIPKFPSWVEGSNDELENDELENERAQASRRLRYLVLMASIACTPGGNIASLADFCNVERTMVHAALKDGKFSTTMAAKIERACGRAVVRREWLIYPLEIQELTI